jgi:hypothetical protein
MNRWSLIYGPSHNGVSITPSTDGCRQWECCGGKECGFTTEEARGHVVDFYLSQAKFFKELNDSDFEAYFGYYPLEDDNE